jgi:hypothetical protein
LCSKKNFYQFRYKDERRNLIANHPEDPLAVKPRDICLYRAIFFVYLSSHVLSLTQNFFILDHQAPLGKKTKKIDAGSDNGAKQRMSH